MIRGARATVDIVLLDIQHNDFALTKDPSVCNLAAHNVANDRLFRQHSAGDGWGGRSFPRQGKAMIKEHFHNLKIVVAALDENVRHVLDIRLDVG